MGASSQEFGAVVASELQLLYSTTVTADQIDALGHMNVRFYGVHALAGAGELCKRIGLPPFREGSAVATYTDVTDLYTRHYLEQLEGAALEVWGSVLEVLEKGVRCYFELRNPVRDEFGATFVFAMQHRSMDSRDALPLSDETASAAKALCIDLPEQDQPRSIDLEVAPTAYSLDELRALNIDESDIRFVDEGCCDENGEFRVQKFMDLAWGGGGYVEMDEDWLRTLENGDRMGWATMESRCTLVQWPRAGTRIQSIRATVELNRKAQREIIWVFDVETKELICITSFVDVAFNINTRRAVEIPDFERERLEAYYRPELG